MQPSGEPPASGYGSRNRVREGQDRPGRHARMAGPRGVLLGFAMVGMLAVVGLVIWAMVPTGAKGQGMTRKDRRASTGISPSAVAPTRSPAARVVPKGYNRLVLDARFTRSSLDTSLWSTCYPWADTGSGCTNYTNHEYEWYIPSQVEIRNKTLELIAQPTPTLGATASGASKEYGCRSGMVTTYPGFRFEYGYVQVIAHISAGPGLWPALWLAAANLQSRPEVDILEHWGSASGRSGMYLHPINRSEYYRHLRDPSLFTGWHHFGLLWTRSEIVWYIDGRPFFKVTANIPHQHMYLIANVAEYRPVSHGSGCQGTMQIRSVKVWQTRGG